MQVSGFGRSFPGSGLGIFGSVRCSKIATMLKPMQPRSRKRPEDLIRKGRQHALPSRPDTGLSQWWIVLRLPIDPESSASDVGRIKTHVRYSGTSVADCDAWATRSSHACDHLAFALQLNCYLVQAYSRSRDAMVRRTIAVQRPGGQHSDRYCRFTFGRCCVVR